MKEIIALCLVVGAAFLFLGYKADGKVRVVERPVDRVVEKIIEKPVIVERQVIVEKPVEPPRSSITARVRTPQRHPNSIDRDGHHLVKVDDRGRVATYHCTRCNAMYTHTLEE
ncbi:MAG: hypothetical protein AB9873_13040 [Syntrophobacteraceae bacterium]